MSNNKTKLSISQMCYLKQICDLPEAFNKGKGKKAALVKATQGAVSNNSSKSNSRNSKKQKRNNRAKNEQCKFDHLKRTFIAETQSMFNSIIGGKPFESFDKLTENTERLTNLLESDVNNPLESFAKIANSMEGINDFVQGENLSKFLDTVKDLSENGLKAKHEIDFKISSDMIYLAILGISASAYFVGNKYFKILSMISVAISALGLVNNEAISNIMKYLLSIIKREGFETQAISLPSPLLAFRMITLCVSGFTIFKNFGSISASSLSKIDKYVKGLAPVVMAMRLGDDLIDTILTFAEKITNVIGGLFDPTFHVSFKGEVWYEFELLRKKLIELTTEFEEKADLGEVARKAQALRADLRGLKVPKEGAAYIQYRDLSNAIAALCEDLSRFGAVGNNMRREPLVTVIGGDPGIGKSNVKQAIMRLVASHILPPKGFKDFSSCPGAYMYNPNQVEKFVSGYENQKFVIVDDLGYTQDSMENMLPRFIQMVNSMPYNVEQAEAHKKGSIYFDSDFILCTSNVQSWKNAASFMTAPDALCRRLHVNIWCEVKPEYAIEVKNAAVPKLMVDPSKVTDWKSVNWLNYYAVDPLTDKKTILCHHGMKCPMEKSDCHAADTGEMIIIIIDEYDRRRNIHELMRKSDEEMLREMAENPTLSAREFAKKFHSFKTQAFCNEDCFSCVRPNSEHYFNTYAKSSIAFTRQGKCECGDVNHNRESLNRFTSHIKESITKQGDDFPEFKVIKDNCYDSLFNGFNTCSYNKLKYLFCSERISELEEIKHKQFEQECPEEFLKTNVQTKVASVMMYASDKFKSAWFKIKQATAGTFVDSIIEWFKSIPRGVLMFAATYFGTLFFAYKKQNNYIDNLCMHYRQLYCIKYGSVPDVITPEVGAEMERLYKGFMAREYMDFPVNRVEKPLVPNAETQSFDENCMDLMKSVVHSNVLHGYVNDEYKFTVLGIGGSIVLINDHVLDGLRSLKKDANVSFKRFGKKLSQCVVSYTLSQINLSHCVKYPDVDMSAIVLPSLECHKMDGYASDEVISGKQAYDFGLAWFNPGTTNAEYNVRIGASLAPIVCRATDTNGKQYITQTPLMYKIATEKGCCGAPVFIMDKRKVKKFAGIHCAGDGDKGCAVRVTLSMLERAYKFFEPITQVVQSNVITMSKENVFYGEMPVKCIEDCQVIGRVNQASSVLTSDICKSPLYNRIPGFAPNKMPAILVPKMVDGELVCPIEKNLKAYARGFIMPEKEILDGVATDYIIKMRKECKPPKETRFMTFEESVKGCANLPFFRAINRGTSAGYPDKLYLTEKKRDAFGYGDEFTFDSEGAMIIRKAYDEAMEALEKGPIEMLANIFPKDELRPKEKAKALKTRLIAGFSCHATLVIRSVFGGFIDWFSNDDNRIKNCSAVGVNVASYAWTEIAQLHGFGHPSRPVFAGDHSTYDKRLHPAVMDKVFDLYMEYFGQYLTDKEKTIARNCWRSLMAVKVVCKDNLIAWGNSNPSGNPLTTLINTICNILLLKYAITRVLIPDVLNKTAVVKLWGQIGNEITITCYGDDNLWSLDKESKLLKSLPKVTYEGIAREMARIGFEYTDEMKSDEFNEEQRTIFQVNFLKRTFVKEEGRLNVLAPLDLSSIMQNIQWMKKKDTDKSLWFTKCETFLSELAVHDKKTYDTLSNLLLDCIDENLPHNPIARSISQEDRRNHWISETKPKL